jgi:hypothetical protein
LERNTPFHDASQLDFSYDKIDAHPLSIFDKRDSRHLANIMRLFSKVPSACENVDNEMRYFPRYALTHTNMFLIDCSCFIGKGKLRGAEQP